MQSIRWLGFCVSQSMSRSLLHFFPSCENASAPYPATCTLTLLKPKDSNARPEPTLPRGSTDPLAGQVERIVVALDGGRLGHPDGLRLEDAFPVLRTEANGMFGLEIEISTPQPRLDVSSSGCVLEVISQSQPVKYTPKKLPATRTGTPRDSAAKEGVRRERWADTRPSRQLSSHVGAESASVGVDDSTPIASRSPLPSGLAVFDSTQSPSLVFVNSSQSGLVAAVWALMGACASSETSDRDLPVTSVALEPGVTREIPLVESMFLEATRGEAARFQGNHFEGADSFKGPMGSQVVIPFCVEVCEEGTALRDAAQEVVDGRSQGSTPRELAIYLLHREIRTRRIVSVLAIDSGGGV